MKRLLLASLLPLAAAAPALAETVNCTNITALPATITVPGVYCLKQDLATSMTSGAAITIAANSVTIDFNGYKLGGLGGGPATQASGVSAFARKNITLRNGNIRGFNVGIALGETVIGSSSGHVVENNLLEANTTVGIIAKGTGVVIRNNRIINTVSFGITYGILANARNSQVVGNLVANTESTGGNAFGIFVDSLSSNMELSRNTVLNTRANGNSAGIASISQGQQAHTAEGNTVIGVTSTASGNGIWNGYSSPLICRDNTIANVTTNPTVGCTAEAGTFPPPGP